MDDGTPGLNGYCIAHFANWSSNKDNKKTNARFFDTRIVAHPATPSQRVANGSLCLSMIRNIANGEEIYAPYRKNHRDFKKPVRAKRHRK
jgi:hypothetical protein